jgi:ribosomal protein S18 acetylase RimI-like enzyme
MTKIPFFETRDRNSLAAYFSNNPLLHLYELGDLDDFYFEYTRWFVRRDDRQITAAVLLYTAFDPPVLLGLAEQNSRGALSSLLSDLLPHLPPRIYAHLSPGLEDLFSPGYTAAHHGLHHKMGLPPAVILPHVTAHKVTRLSSADADELTRLYDEHYPAHAFDPRMLTGGVFWGVKAKGKIIAAAGVHVYSPQYQVAAIGNVVTHTAFRGLGLAKQVTIKLCQDLSNTVKTIGLNVKADNTPALRLYAQLGFVHMADYCEISFAAR